MKKIKMFILFDEQDGYKCDRIYLDKDSAEIGLTEHYTEYWIENKKAEVKEIDAVSYFVKHLEEDSSELVDINTEIHQKHGH